MLIKPFLSVSESLNFYAVVSTADQLARVNEAGANTILLRNKNLFGSALYHEIERSVAYAQQNSVQLLINDYWWEALDCGAYGIHLGQKDLDSVDLIKLQGAGLRLGVSFHTQEELNKTVLVQPSYIAYNISQTSTGDTLSSQSMNKVKVYLEQVGTTPFIVTGVKDVESAIKIKSLGVSAVVFDVINDDNQLNSMIKAYQQLWQC